MTFIAGGQIIPNRWRCVFTCADSCGTDLVIDIEATSKPDAAAFFDDREPTCRCGAKIVRDRPAGEPYMVRTYERST